MIFNSLNLCKTGSPTLNDQSVGSIRTTNRSAYIYSLDGVSQEVAQQDEENNY